MGLSAGARVLPNPKDCYMLEPLLLGVLGVWARIASNNYLVGVLYRIEHPASKARPISREPVNHPREPQRLYALRLSTYQPSSSIIK